MINACATGSSWEAALGGLGDLQGPGAGGNFIQNLRVFAVQTLKPV